MAAQAEDSVEEWAPNYYAIGRTHLTAIVLRERLTRWTTRFLETDCRRKLTSGALRVDRRHRARITSRCRSIVPLLARNTPGPEPVAVREA